MPGTPDEYLRHAIAEVGLETSLVPRWDDGTAITAEEARDIVALRVYYRRTVRDRPKRGPQRLAMKLLRSFLSPEQRRQLRTGKQFLVHARSGRTYRLYPRTGLAELVARHGRRYFVALRFCIHDDQSDPAESMPPADLTLAHFLMLMADEEEFLATANARDVRDQLWNGEYLRRLRQARQERTSQASEAA